MAKNGNGIWKVITTIGIIVVGAAIAWGALYKTVGDMEPKVEKNTEHRIKFEEKVTNMDEKIDKILEEVKK